MAFSENSSRSRKPSAPVNVAATDHGDSPDIIVIQSRPGAPINLYFVLIMPARFVRWRKYSCGTFNISVPTPLTPMFAAPYGTSQIGKRAFHVVHKYLRPLDVR